MFAEQGYKPPLPHTTYMGRSAWTSDSCRHCSSLHKQQTIWKGQGVSTQGVQLPPSHAAWTIHNSSVSCCCMGRDPSVCRCPEWSPSAPATCWQQEATWRMIKGKGDLPTQSQPSQRTPDWSHSEQTSDPSSETRSLCLLLAGLPRADGAHVRPVK